MPQENGFQPLLFLEKPPNSAFVLLALGAFTLKLCLSLLRDSQPEEEKFWNDRAGGSG